jgi:hypothetical protein
MNASQMKELATSALNLERKIEEGVFKVTTLCMQSAMVGKFSLKINLNSICCYSDSKLAEKVIQQVILVLRDKEYTVSI